MRRSQTSTVVLSCALALSSLTACGSDGEPSDPRLAAMNPHEDAGDGESDAGAPPKHDAATHGDAGAGADAGTDPLAKFANWHLPTPGTCGELPLSFANEPATPTTPDWTENAKVPATGLPNRYGYVGQQLTDYVRAGETHMVDYPVSVTASWLPRNIIEKAFTDSLSKLLPGGNPLSAYKNLDDFEAWLGMKVYPDCDGGGARSVPFPNGVRPDYRMGSSRTQLADGPAVTYSCAGCHASRLFGRSILGLQNRTAHANVGIDKARKTLEGLPVQLVQLYFGATEGDARILQRLQEGLAAVDIRARRFTQSGDRRSSVGGRRRRGVHQRDRPGRKPHRCGRPQWIAFGRSSTGREAISPLGRAGAARRYQKPAPG